MSHEGLPENADYRVLRQSFLYIFDITAVVRQETLRPEFIVETAVDGLKIMCTFAGTQGEDSFVAERFK